MNNDRFIMEKNRMGYLDPSKSELSYRTKNAIFISNANSYAHEISKCVGAILIRKFGDLKFNKKMISLIVELEKEIKQEFEDWDNNPTDFVTEAVPRRTPERRVDLVELRRNIKYEFETDKRIKKKDSCIIYI